MTSENLSKILQNLNECIGNQIINKNKQISEKFPK